MELKNLKSGPDKAKIYYPPFSLGTDVENIHLESGNPMKIHIFSSDPLVLIPNWYRPKKSSSAISISLNGSQFEIFEIKSLYGASTILFLYKILQLNSSLG